MSKHTGSTRALEVPSAGAYYRSPVEFFPLAQGHRIKEAGKPGCGCATKAPGGKCSCEEGA